MFRTRWNARAGDDDQRSTVSAMRSEDSIGKDSAVAGLRARVRTFVIAKKGKGACDCLWVSSILVLAPRSLSLEPDKSLCMESEA